MQNLGVWGNALQKSFKIEFRVILVLLLNGDCSIRVLTALLEYINFYALLFYPSVAVLASYLISAQVSMLWMTFSKK